MNGARDGALSRAAVRPRVIAMRANSINTAWIAGWLTLCALSASTAVAQDVVWDQLFEQVMEKPENSGLGSRSGSEQAVKADGDLNFFADDFSGTTLNKRNWRIAIGVMPTGESNPDHVSFDSLRLAAGPALNGSTPTLCSRPVSLFGVPGARLSYTVQHHGAEIGQRLFVEYIASDGQWRPLECAFATAGDSTSYERHTRLLPSEALHARFQFRFRAEVNDRDNAWYLGEVAVAGYEPLQNLAVRVQPAGEARVSVILAGRTDEMTMDTPFLRRYPVGSRVHLVASPTVNAKIFSHWTINGIERAPRQRAILLELTGQTEAVAHYRPWVAGRESTTVAVISRPVGGVPIELGLEPAQFITEIHADTEFPCLTGEWLTLQAPLRTERMVFSDWIVDGQRFPSGNNIFEHQIRGAEVIEAEYVLLGDVNGDDLLDKYDVDLFIAALVDPLGYAQVYPELDRLQRCDINDDGVFDTQDVEAFVDLLLRH